MDDYRSEWLSDVLIERITWREEAAPRPVSPEMPGPVVVKPGYIWTRFWMQRESQVVEKYFSAKGTPLGFYLPVCMPLEQHGSELAADALGLALWMDMAGRVTVLGEPAFDAAVEEGSMSPVAQELAEQRVRELTTLVAQRKFPPPLVRNFAILIEERE